MITRENLKDVLSLISKKDLKRIKNSNKEYIELKLFQTNSFSKVDIKLTNSLKNFNSLVNNGNCILKLEEVKELLNIK